MGRRRCDGRRLGPLGAQAGTCDAELGPRLCGPPPGGQGGAPGGRRGTAGASVEMATGRWPPRSVRCGGETAVRRIGGAVMEPISDRELDAIRLHRRMNVAAYSVRITDTPQLYSTNMCSLSRGASRRGSTRAAVGPEGSRVADQVSWSDVECGCQRPDGSHVRSHHGVGFQSCHRGSSDPSSQRQIALRHELPGAGKLQAVRYRIGGSARRCESGASNDPKMIHKRVPNELPSPTRKSAPCTMSSKEGS